MTTTRVRPAGRTVSMAGMLLLGASAVLGAQQSQQGDAPPPPTLAPGNLSQQHPDQPGQPQPSAARTSTEADSDSSPASKAVEGTTQPDVKHPGVLLDRVVAVVNGEVVLESDVALEQRMAAFQPVTDPRGGITAKKATDRLINRALLLQQAKLQPHKTATDADAAEQITTLRKEIPACKEYACETEAGWQRYLREQQVTEVELQTYLRRRLDALAFIELRFRSGVRITHQQIQDYYEQTMLPEYKARGVKPPALDNLETRIQEVLLQQQVSGLLSDWLKSLRAQGTVQIVEGGPADS